MTMRNTTFLSTVLLLGCMMWSSATLAKDPTKPGPMQRAIAHLDAARNATKPLISLRAARRSVVDAKANKGGERKKAIHAIDQAIEAAESGDTRTMTANISDAIYDIKQGINNAK